ncbi:hypothetical protein POM88_010574 [Heracleum sosnowskyi]|uniref:Uncharacterized protein n=1 Tax=Heracleum sosnowskyi TaxID=360622 RepID=A0AAD8N1M7_9APIA|nr:hypothetical protein POM88_010574 [Heracleum sosnowskyi]
MTFFERLAGWVNLLEASIMWVMQTYLTTVWGLSVSHAAGIINVWNGLTFFLPIPFAFFADSFFGNFYMLMFSCFVDAIGLGFLTLSTRQSLESEKLPEDHNTESFYQSDDHVELTHWFRFLNKAARILPTASIEEQKKNKWHLCSVKEVEDTKVCLRMTPLCITLVLCGLVFSLGNTYFLEQANHLNQTLGRLKVNSLIFFFFSFGADIITSNIYRIAKTCTLERYRKYFPIFGIAYALINSVLCCIIAAKVESRRLVNKEKSMSMFWLVPQYILLGVFTGISSICYEELFKTRYPSSMSKYVQYFTLGLTGIGTAASYLLVYIVGKVSERGKNPSWFMQSLNESHLDKYYWTLAVISSLNLFLYIIVVRILPHPKPKRANTIKKVKNMVQCKCRCCGCCC